MSENFRNKQWFKNMPQERKDEICKSFDIEEKTLRKAGRETDNGRLVIDILRIDHLCHYPEEWDLSYNSIKNSIDDFKNRVTSTISDTELVDVFKSIYDLFETHTYLKYKDTLHNKVLVNQTKDCILNDINDYYVNDEESRPYYAHRIRQHLNILIESDLNLIK